MIEITPGQSIQQAVNDAPAGTEFFLRAGIHPIVAPITPKTGNTFRGEFGAVLDGTGWATPDLDDAAFKALNADVDNVTIKNLEIRNMPQKGIMAYRDFSSGWTVDHCDIHHCKNGVELPANSTVSNCKIHHCVGTPGHPNPAERGGGYSFNTVSGVRFLNNEVYENGTEQKWILCTHITCAGNRFYRNAYAGPWIDGGGASSVIEDNVCEDNLGPGIVVEIASGVTVRLNTCRRNGEGGILISTSQGNEVAENTLEHNAFGIDLFLDCARLSEHYPPHPDPDLAHNNIHDNTVVVGAGQLASIFTHMGGCEGPYIANSKHNDFARNGYTVPGEGRFWVWGNEQKKTFPEWQAIPQDATDTPDPEPPDPPLPEVKTCELNGATYPEGGTTEVTIKRNRVSAWTADHPEWHVVATKPHPKNKSQVILTVRCQP